MTSVLSSQSVSHDVLHQLSMLDCWQGTIHASVLGGGITNRNYLVEDDAGRFVVRMGDDIAVHHIRRANELATSRAAHDAGVAPAVRFHAPGVLVLDYIAGRPLTEATIRHPDKLPQVIDLIRHSHTAIPQHLRGESVAFWVFHVVRDYAATLRDANSRYASHLDNWLAMAQRLETAAGPFDLVFGHNDLLAANILDDGNRLWLIDWEYAGFNTPLFDLGGLASNSAFSNADEALMLQLYYGKPADSALLKRYQAMKCASLLRETLWSMVSEIHSTLDFDYVVYSQENLQRFNSAMQAFDDRRSV